VSYLVLFSNDHSFICAITHHPTNRCKTVQLASHPTDVQTYVDSNECMPLTNSYRVDHSSSVCNVY